MGSLRWSRSPVAGYCLEIRYCAIAPPEYGTSADEYRGYLRARWRVDPAPFHAMVRDAQRHSVTLLHANQPELAEVLYDALVKVAAHQDIDLAGGEVVSEDQRNVSGRYVPG